MKELRFDEGFRSLGEIVKKLEDPATALEDAFRFYKEAMLLAKQLREKIDEMEKEIRIIAENGDEGTGNNIQSVDRSQT